MKFRVLKKSKKSKARLGIIKTKNGVLHTPAFFPVATQGAVKTLDSQDIRKIGFEAVLCNTYHLMLRPGSKLIQQTGGLHKFMGFQGVIATDSGGFQVFSLGKGLEQGIGKIAKIFPGQKKKKQAKQIKPSLVKIREEGVWFRSHLDGKEFFLSPEKSIQIQQEMAADIIFSFDECTSPLDGLAYTKKAMERTHRWAERCLKAKSKTSQGLFGIVQGGEYKGLRQKSAKFIGSLGFSGFGIGGSLGKTKQRIFQVLDWTIPLLPENKPRHLLGIGYLEDMEKAIKKGIDLFDCVYPTRLARHGADIVSQNKIINLNRPGFLKDKEPINSACSCPACQGYSISYLSHLLRAGETTAMRLVTLHNLYFFRAFMDNMRERIKNNEL